MFALSPLAIALQGIGFSPLLTAVHGLISYDAEPPVIVPIADSKAGSGGGFKTGRRIRRARRPIVDVAFLNVADNEDDDEALALSMLLV